jgi:PilZ domain
MSDPKPSAPGISSDSYAERRRSQRVVIAMPVIVRGKHAGKQFEEETTTVSVSANGCLVRLAATVVRAQEIAVVNPKTAEELPSIVTFVGLKDGNKTEVGVEFGEPSPLFWRIAFPPPDWDAAERKRPTGLRPPVKPAK